MTTFIAPTTGTIRIANSVAGLSEPLAVGCTVGLRTEASDVVGIIEQIDGNNIKARIVNCGADASLKDGQVVVVDRSMLHSVQ